MNGVLCIAQVEDQEHILSEISRQTVQPDTIAIYVDDNPAKGIDERRKRIAHNHELLKDIVRYYNPKFVWQVEGDCVFREDTLERLIGDYDKLKGDDFGFISGVQVGRHGLYCLGAWQNITDISFESIDHTKTGIHPVDGTGFYCIFAEASEWLKGVCAWNGEPYGPDVVWGLSISKQKYVDMDIQVGHKVRSGVIWPHHASTCSARFYKEGQRWKYKQL